MVTGRPGGPGKTVKGQLASSFSARRLRALPDGELHGAGDHFRVSHDLGLPEANDSPPRFFQSPRCESIPGHVGFDLWDPVRGITATFQASLSISPTASVPEVTVAENDDLRAGEYDVWRARQRLNVKTVTVSTAPQQTPQQELRSASS